MSSHQLLNVHTGTQDVDESENANMLVHLHSVTYSSNQHENIRGVLLYRIIGICIQSERECETTPLLSINVHSWGVSEPILHGTAPHAATGMISHTYEPTAYS